MRPGDGRRWPDEALLEIVKGGTPAGLRYTSVPDGPLYVRIPRLDGTLSFMFGPDGKRWISHKKLAVNFPAKLQVGLVASNMSKQPLSARFEEFLLVTDRKLVDELKAP